MRRALVITVAIVLAVAVVVALRDHGSGGSDDLTLRPGTPIATVPPPTAPVTIRLDGAPIGCFDWGSIHAAPLAASPPLPNTGDVIQTARVTAMTVCQRGYDPLHEARNTVRAYRVTDPSQASRIIAAANQQREATTGICAGVGYFGDDQVLVRYGSLGVDRVQIGYGSCGSSIASSLSRREGASIQPHMLDALVPIAITPPTRLARSALPCPLRAPPAGRGTPQRAPFVARATRSVSICRYATGTGQLQHEFALGRNRYPALERWLGSLPPHLPAAQCTPTATPAHDALLVIDKNRDAYSIDLHYGDCGAADSIFSSRSGATPEALEHVLASTEDAGSPTDVPDVDLTMYGGAHLTELLDVPPPPGG